MTLKNRAVVEDYRKNRDAYVKLDGIVYDILSKAAKDSGITVMAIEHRIKSEESLLGKLERKSDKYKVFDDFNDILGARVICFFADEVDILGKEVEKAFVIDRAHSTDKRALIQADAFGYLSLHYICSLPFDSGYPDEVCGKRFEVQLRTNLQHTWAAINHDIGYKSQFGVPRSIRRDFARIAGLLEIADNEFVRVRNAMTAYADETRLKIKNNNADDVALDRISLHEYIEHNTDMRAFLRRLAEMSGAEIQNVDSDSYLDQLFWLKKQTIGDLQKMLAENEPLALALAERTLKDSELDILSSSVGLRFLCRAELLNKGYTQEQAAEFIALSLGDKTRAEHQAARLYKVGSELKGGAQ